MSKKNLSNFFEINFYFILKIIFTLWKNNQLRKKLKKDSPYIDSLLN